MHTGVVLLTLALLLLAPASGEAQVRMLRAKQLSTGKWLQRIDTGAQKARAAFQTEVAGQFGLPESDVDVVESTVTSAQHQTAVAEQGAGTHEGLAVVVATAPVLERPDAMRQALGSIFAGTALQKRQRWVAVLEQYPAAQAWLTLLRSPLTPDAKATLTEIATRIKARIGGLSEVLTQTEYDALKTLATAHDLGSLVP